MFNLFKCFSWKRRKKKEEKKKRIKSFWDFLKSKKRLKMEEVKSYSDSSNSDSSGNIYEGLDHHWFFGTRKVYIRRKDYNPRGYLLKKILKQRNNNYKKNESSDSSSLILSDASDKSDKSESSLNL